MLGPSEVVTESAYDSCERRYRGWTEFLLGSAREHKSAIACTATARIRVHLVSSAPMNFANVALSGIKSIGALRSVCAVNFVSLPVSCA